MALVAGILLGALSAGAMPTEVHLAKVRPDVEEMTASGTAAEAVELVGKTESEATKYLLLRKAAELYVKAKDYDGAAAALGALYLAIPDIPPLTVADEVARVARGVKEKSAPRLLALLRRSRELDAARKALKKTPDRLVLWRNAAELAASVGLWQEACGLFTRLGGPAGKAAADETEDRDLPDAADFW